MPSTPKAGDAATVNNTAQAAITSFFELKEPGYAMLVDAPWGAGKTHLIKSLLPQKSRYVSLNGVATENEFRRAILRDSLDASLFDRGQLLGDAIGEWIKIPGLGGLARDVAEDHLLVQLPKILIFDDLERATLCPEVLFGLINDYVEHQARNVLLVANIEKHPTIDIFRARKEKLIGRSVSVVADFESAFPIFVAKLPEGQGRKYFKDNQQLVRQVFEDASHQNLRLLRNVLFETGHLIDRIEEELFKGAEAMQRLVRTHLALGMAIARGDIQSSDIEKRSNIAIASTKDCGPEFAELSTVYHRHQEGYDIFSHSGSVLPDELAHELYVTGYVSSEYLNNALRGTKQFYPQEPNPLWKRVVYWPKLPSGELEALVDEARIFLLEETDIQPGPYLHIADGLLRIYENSGLVEEQQKLRGDILSAIKRLASQDRIPIAEYGIHFGWSDELSGFSYGGYSVQPNDLFQSIINAMRDAQLKAFKNSVPALSAKLLDAFSADIEHFVALIEYDVDGFSFDRTPIFHHLSPEEFARQAMEHVHVGRIDQVETAIDQITRRHRQKELWDPERLWLDQVAASMKEIASQSGPIHFGRVNYFLKHVWPPRREDEDSEG